MRRETTVSSYQLSLASRCRLVVADGDGDGPTPGRAHAHPAAGEPTVSCPLDEIFTTPARRRGWPLLVWTAEDPR